MRYVLSKMMQEIGYVGKITPCVGSIFFLLHAQKQCIQFVFVSSTGPFYNMTPEERIDADNRSVYVGNVRLVSFPHTEQFLFFHTPDLTHC